MPNCNQIRCSIIDHKHQRYNTVGDYYYDTQGCLVIKVSDLGDDTMNRLVLIHELIEEFTTQHRGIDEETIMEFDKAYEEERELGLHKDTDEPGFDKRAPYLEQHTLATSIEMLLCAYLGVSWNDYTDKVNSL